MAQPGDSLNDFGLVIAFLIPGFAALFGSSYFFPDLRPMFTVEGLNGLSIAGLALIVVVSLTAGLIVHTIRWLLLDSLHHLIGTRPEEWDFSKFATNVAAYDRLTEIHYRYYQFYGGMTVSSLWTLLARGYASSFRFEIVDAALLLLVALTFLGSHDTLSKYYHRLNAILNPASTSTAEPQVP